MTSERRKADRYPLGVKVEFDGGTGLTRDVSGLGVFFVTDVRFGIGDDVAFLLVIPEAVNVQCSGTVARVLEEEDGRWGIGVAIDTYEIAPDQTEPEGPAHLILQELRRHHTK